MAIQRLSTKVLGDIKLLNQLGRGGFGVVHLAENSNGDQFAAKIIGPLRDALDRETFDREVSAAQQVTHPNVVSVIDHGLVDEAGATFAYSVMELCREGDYRKVLSSRKGSHVDEECVRIEFREILEGLTAVHAVVLHRDLKPENVLLDSGSLKLTDFGLSKMVDEATRTLSFKGFGTPRYMAPETWLQQRASPATDLYSIGVMLFEALTGHPPFDSPNLIQLRDLHLYTPAPRVRASNTAIPEYLDGIVKKLLEKEPNKRYQTAQAVIIDLQSVPSKASSKDVSDIVGRIRQHRDAEERRILKSREQRESIQNEAAAIRYKERELADALDEVVAEINGHLPDANITKRVLPDGNVGYQLRIRSLVLHFFAHDQMFWNPEFPGRMGALRQRHVVHGGYLEIRENGGDREGWNLVLVKPPESMYGDWIVVETDISALTGSARYKPFATDAKLFADNLASHWAPAMHTYVLKDYPLSRDVLLRIMKAFVGP